MALRGTLSSFLLIAVSAGAQVAVPVPAPRPEFSVFLADLKSQAIARGIRAETAERALTSLEPLEIVIERDRTQAETVLTIDQYLQRRLTRSFVRTAKEKAAAHRAL